MSEITEKVSYHMTVSGERMCDVDLSTVVNGVEYERHGWGTGSGDASAELKARKQVEGEFWASNSGDAQVLCVCLNDSFRITYGDYECFATCTKCGRSDSICDG